MKTLALLFASVVALGFGGCSTDDSLMSDEEYKTYSNAAPHAPDPTRHMPQRNDRSMGTERY